jgi:hypothetical protein
MDFCEMGNLLAKREFTAEIDAAEVITSLIICYWHRLTIFTDFERSQVISYLLWAPEQWVEFNRIRFHAKGSCSDAILISLITDYTT